MPNQTIQAPHHPLPHKAELSEPEKQSGFAQPSSPATEKSGIKDENHSTDTSSTETHPQESSSHPEPQTGYYQYQFSTKLVSKLFSITWSVGWLILLITAIVSYLITFDSFIGTQVALTVWSYYVTTLYMLSNLFYSVSEPEYNSWRYNAHRVLHTLSAINELCVFVGYWPMAHHDIPTYKDRCSSVGVCTTFTIVAHLLILIPPWTALFVQKTDVRWSDLTPFVIFNGAYTAVLIGYTIFVSPVYPIYTFLRVIDYVVVVVQWCTALFFFWAVLSISRRKRERLQSRKNVEAKSEE